jgi:hypothetical protein
MVTNDDLAEVLWGFLMALPKLPLEEKSLLDREYEAPFFEALGDSECLTAMDVSLWAKPMRALLDHLIFQYISVLTSGYEWDLPPDLLAGCSDGVWRRPLLSHLAKRRWPVPSEVPWKGLVPRH